MMSERPGHWLAATAIVAFAALGAVDAEAATLVQKLSQTSVKAGAQVVGGSTQIFDVFVPRLSVIAARGVDFPAAGTTPGFTYSYNPDLGLFERSPSLGPALLERADTVGKGRFTIGGSYLYGDLSEDGNHSIRNNSQPVALYDASSTLFVTGIPTRQTFRSWSLHENVFGFAATYGLTDRWDVNVLVPVVWTTLHATNAVSAGGDVAKFGTNGEKVGVGDILLRTKYRLTNGGPIDLAAGLVLKMPSGKQEDFQGNGDFTIEPLFIASKSLGIASFHLNAGMEADTNDLESSRARYGAGVAVQVIEQLAVLVDILGSSGLSDTSADVTVGIPNFSGGPNLVLANLTEALQGPPPVSGVRVSGSGQGKTTTLSLIVPRTDVVDLSAGFKFSLPFGFIGFAAAIVPLTTDGIHATVVPTGGLSYTF